MIINITLFISGFILLIKGANWLIDGSSELARKKSISDLTIGLTIVAFGTSLPELVVNIISSMQNHANIAFGNIIGSNNFNLFIILGIVGLINPIIVQSRTVWREIPLSFIAALILFILVNDTLINKVNILNRMDGFILILFFGLFIYYMYKQINKDILDLNAPQKYFSVYKIGRYIIFGLIALILGGKLVVDNAIKIAENFGLSEKLIGLTIVAAGTSLPELITSLVAVVKKNTDIAVGNIIGSNIFNIFLILGASSLIRPLIYNIELNTDIFILMFGTIILFVAMFTGIKKRLDRWEAGVLLLTYLLYSIYIIYK